MKREKTYGIWINKTKALEILDSMPWHVASPTPCERAGYSEPMYYRDEVIYLSHQHAQKQFGPEYFKKIQDFNFNLDRQIVSDDVYALVE